MSNRITIKQLESIVEGINRATNSPLEPYTRDENGKWRANIGNFHLSQAYGGVELQRMVTEGGGVSCPAWNGHIPKREAAERLWTFRNGLEYAKHESADA